MRTVNGIEPGNKAPSFNLPNANEEHGDSQVSLTEAIGEKGGIVMFTCNHCPYVVASESRIEAMATMARELGFGFVGINSNDPVRYTSDDWEHMVERASKGMSYPYLHDSTQEVAIAYGAERTPEFYLISGDLDVLYRGRLDDSPRDPSNVTTSDLEIALSQYVAGERIKIPRTESIGCSVKWIE